VAKMVQLDVPVAIEILTRKQALFHVVSEFALKILENDSLGQSIKKGILEKEIIEEISFCMLNLEKKIVAKIKLEIDWERHQIKARSEDGNKFKISKNKSVAMQLLSIAESLSTLIDDAKKHYGKISIETTFKYRDELRGDPGKY
jgi:hypothetical protein